MNSRQKPLSPNRLITFGAVTLSGLALLLCGAPVLANDDSSVFDFPRGRGWGAVYTVTITNLTYDQIIRSSVPRWSSRTTGSFACSSPDSRPAVNWRLWPRTE